MLGTTLSIFNTFQRLTRTSANYSLRFSIFKVNLRFNPLFYIGQHFLGKPKVQHDLKISTFQFDPRFSTLIF